MAKEITLNLTLSFSKGGVSTSMPSYTQQFDVAGTDYIKETFTVPTSVTALPLGSVATPRYCMMTNKDPTNYVEVFDSVSGNACVRVGPGRWACFEFTTTAPAVKSHTATCKIEYLVIAN